MIKNIWEFHFASEPLKVRQIVRDILSYLDETLPGQSQDVRGDLKLVFNELLFNAVIHGNAMDCRKRVFIKLEVCENTLFASVADEGPGYDYQKIPQQMPDDLHKESGRGMKLVYALTDSVSFNQTGNQVMFVKKMGS